MSFPPSPLLWVALTTRSKWRYYVWYPVKIARKSGKLAGNGDGIMYHAEDWKTKP